MKVKPSPVEVAVDNVGVNAAPVNALAVIVFDPFAYPVRLVATEMVALAPGARPVTVMVLVVPVPVIVLVAPATVHV